jgi:hypothetical protein
MAEHSYPTSGARTGAKEARNKPSDLDGPGYSDKSYRPGYPLDRSLQECDETDLKTGFKKGG